MASRTRYNGDKWDADRIFGCDCDDGWTGYDCSLRTCPTGDDPNSYDQNKERQVLRCVATNGTFTLAFRGETTRTLFSNESASDVEAALEALDTIDSVNVVMHTGNETAADDDDDESHGGRGLCSPRARNEALVVVPTLLSSSGYPGGEAAAGILEAAFVNETINLTYSVTQPPSGEAPLVLKLKVKDRRTGKLVPDSKVSHTVSFI